MSPETYNLWSIILSVATLAALLFYTYYTRQLLITSQAATKSTQKELELMQEQLRIAQAAIDTEKDRELRRARPLFVWKGGSFNQDGQTVAFTNRGGAIAIMESRATNCELKMRPGNFIGEETVGAFDLIGPNGGATRYAGIKFITTMGEIQVLIFNFAPGTISPQIDRQMSFESMRLMDRPSQMVEIIDGSNTVK